MSVALALLAGLCWAAGDYLVARSGRKERAITVVVAVQLVAIPFLVPLAILGNSDPAPRDLVFGLLAGLAGASGFVAFIKGAAAHEMGVVVPLSAVASAAVAVVAGLFAGDSYGIVSWIGLGVAFIGIALVSRAQEEKQFRLEGHQLGIVLGVVSGVLFGLLYILLGVTDSDSGLWPLVAMRISVLPLAFVAYRVGAPLLPRPSSRNIVLASSLFAIVGLILYVWSARSGPIGVAAVITSMSPAGTVALARFVDGEHVSRTRFAGIVIVLISIALLAAS